MGLRNPARFLAPLALVAALVGVIAVVQASRPDSGDSTSSRTTTAQTAPQRRGGRRRRAQSRVYVVRAGDSLSVISERTGVESVTTARP